MASSALRDELVDLSPLATGLQITGLGQPTGPVSSLVRSAERREQAVRALGRRLGLEHPLFTVETALPLTLSTRGGDVPLNLLARTGVLAHVKILAQKRGPGVYVSDPTARIAGIAPGGVLRLSYADRGATRRTVALRVKGIYRALDSTSPGPYWVHFEQEIVPRGVDPPPPVRYVLLGRDELYRAVHRLGGSPVGDGGGSGVHTGSGPPVGTMAELAVRPQGLTVARGRSLSRRFTRLRHELRGSALGKSLGCAGARPVLRAFGPSTARCSVSSSLSSALAIADRNVSEISPVVILLSGAATAIALAFAAAAGIFLVRRRAVETAFLYARGERGSIFALRTGLELLLPLATGAALGLGAALGATKLFTPAGSVDSATVGSALRDGVLAAAAALLLGAGAAMVTFLRQFDSGTRAHRWLRRIPWELPLLVGAAWLLYELLSGGGLAGEASGAGHPTLSVFLFPLLLVAAVAGLVMRALRPALRARKERGAALPASVFLALRRLAAAGGVLTALLVVSAVAFGSFFYARTVAASLSNGVAEKAYVAYGGDAQGLISGSTELPRHFRYPLTRLDFGNQAAVVGSPDGAYADILAVDASTLGSVLRWYPDWGSDPRPLLPSLARPAGARLPVVVSDTVPENVSAIWVQGSRLPVRVVMRVHVFPGMSAGVPLVVADRGALAAVARRAGVLDPLSDPPSYVWAKGPPLAAARALAGPPVEAAFVSDVDAFRKQPDVRAATRAFSYMRLVASASGLLVFLGLVLYLQTRQRSQAVASSLAARMGLRRRTEIISLALELGAITLVAAVVGGVVAVAAAAPVVGHIDPLPDYAPGPALTVPLAAILGSAAGLLLVALLAGAFTSWTLRRTNTAEALRVV